MPPRADIWTVEEGEVTRLFYRSQSRFTQRLIYILAPVPGIFLLILLALAFRSGAAGDIVIALAMVAGFAALVYWLHQREQVHEIGFRPGVVRVLNRDFPLATITRHGRAEWGGDVAFLGSLPRNFTHGPHLFIQEGGRLLPITPVLPSDQARRLGEVFEGVMGRYLGEG